jgi:hypothetical protein
LQQEPLASLFARPAALGRALRRASELLALEVECLDVPATWILHGAGWPATVGEQGIELGPAPVALRPPVETASNGPLAAVREALRALPPSSAPPATLMALPSPATLALAAGAGHEKWAQATLRAFVRLVGEIDVVVGVMLDGDDGVAALGGLLDHYGFTPVCLRGVGDSRPAPVGALVARALSIEALMGGAPGELGPLVTSDGPVAPLVEPEHLLRAGRAMALHRAALATA